MNFAFVVVVLAALTGLAAQLALRTIAPESGPALALAVMALGLLGAAWRTGRKRVEVTQRATMRMPKSAGESLAPT